MKLIRSPLSKVQPKTIGNGATTVSANRNTQVATIRFLDTKYSYTVEIAIGEIADLKHKLDVAKAFCTEKEL